MTDAEKTGSWEEWMDNPLRVDHPEGAEIIEPEIFQMQIRQADGWLIFNVPSTDRDKITTVQAYHLKKHGNEEPIRVLRGYMTWVVDEVPGYGEGQTPPEEILARNDEIVKRQADKTQQPE